MSEGQILPSQMRPLLSSGDREVHEHFGGIVVDCVCASAQAFIPPSTVRFVPVM